MSQLGESVNKYCRDNGVQKQWIAKKIGLDKRYFYQILSGKFSLPQKYWVPLMKATRGEVGLSDLIHDVLSEEFTIESLGGWESCVVSCNEKKDLKINVV